jgi:hypothetical protein
MFSFSVPSAVVAMDTHLTRFDIGASPASARAALSFRSRLDDYLVHLLRGEIEAAVEAHFAPEARLVENGEVKAQDAETALRKLKPVSRRFAMLRGTLDDLVCDRLGGTASFRIRFEGVDVDGRMFVEDVFFRQLWRLGRIVEEDQWRGEDAERPLGRDARAPGAAPVSFRPLRLVGGLDAVI